MWNGKLSDNMYVNHKRVYLYDKKSSAYMYVCTSENLIE